MLYPIVILLLGISLQGIFLLFRSETLRMRGIEWTSAAVFALSTVSMVLMARQSAESLVLMNLLTDAPLLRLPRAALFLAAFLVSRAIVSSREIPQVRKPEVLFLLTFVVAFVELLLLSQSILLSVLLLISISWLTAFLSGLAFRGRKEGEAMLKGWVQSSLVTALGLGSVLVLLWISGGSSYSAVSKGLGLASPVSAYVGILALFLPYFLAAGLFPFHFLPMDRDQGVPWAVQLIFNILIKGSVLLSLWKVAVDVLHLPGSSLSVGLSLLQLAAVVGGFWLAIFALSQGNSKRLFSSLVGASWALALAAGCNPTALSAAAIVYAFAALFLWSVLLGFTWCRLQESSGQEGIADVLGMARKHRTSGLFLLIALSAAIGVPGLSGMPVALHLLAAMIEQRSLVLLLVEATLLALVLLSFLRIGSDLLFRGSLEQPTFDNSPQVKYAALDYLGVMGLAGGLLFLGIWWNRIFVQLSETAKLFLN